MQIRSFVRFNVQLYEKNTVRFYMFVYNKNTECLYFLLRHRKYLYIQKLIIKKLLMNRTCYVVPTVLTKPRILLILNVHNIMLHRRYRSYVSKIDIINLKFKEPVT